MAHLGLTGVRLRRYNELPAHVFTIPATLRYQTMLLQRQQRASDKATEQRKILAAARKALEQVHLRTTKKAEEERQAIERRNRLEKEAAERMAKERARKDKINAKLREKRAMKSNIKKVLAQLIQPRAIPFANLEQWMSVRDMSQPFALTLRSGSAPVTRNFNFTSSNHFQNWLRAIDKQNTIKDSENYQNYADAIGDDANVFDFITPSVAPVVGGCNFNGEERMIIETPFHTLHVFSPQTKHNNCGFKVIEFLTNCKLDYSAERKKYNIPYDAQLTIDVMRSIFQEHSTRLVNFIDDSFDFNIEYKIRDYIFIRNNHYYAVTNAIYKTFKDQQTKRGLLTWDIETRPSEEYVMVGERKSYILKPTILAVCYKRFQTEEITNIVFTTNTIKDCCRQFLDWLTNEAMHKHFYHCIAHNGSRFDHYFLLSQLNQQEQEHTETQLRGCSIIGLQYKSHLFKDSCCFLTNSLESLCKSFKVKQSKLTEFTLHGEILTNKNICFYKPELTFAEFMNLQTNDTEYWTEYVDYCIMDCVSLLEIWTTFNNQYNVLVEKIFKGKEGLLKNVRLMGTNTIGSLAKKILENSCLTKFGSKYVKTNAYKSFIEFIYTDGKEDPVKIEFINKFKRGGISHTNQPGKHTHELISYDIASQYPASMLYMSIPSGKSTHVNKYHPLKHGFYHIKNLIFNTAYHFKPIASKNDNGVLNWSNDSIEEIYIDSFMLKYMIQNYGLTSFDVIEGYVSDHYIKGKDIFGDYVETLYNEKKNQDALKDSKSADYNPALRECIKLFLNSLSGKLVEDPSRYFTIAYSSENTKLQLNGLSITKSQEGQKFNVWVSAGIMVYSYSKRLLFEYVKCLPNNSDDVIHIETDSIYFNKKHNATFIKNIASYKPKGIDHYPIAIGSELGNVKVEKDTKEVSYFLGKKFYCIGDLYKIKGIPLKTIDKFGNDVSLVDNTLYEDIYNRKTLVKEFYTMKKSLFSQTTFISSHKMSRTIRPAMEYQLYE
jgi:hypothetical protein